MDLRRLRARERRQREGLEVRIAILMFQPDHILPGLQLVDAGHRPAARIGRCFAIRHRSLPGAFQHAVDMDVSRAGACFLFQHIQLIAAAGRHRHVVLRKVRALRFFRSVGAALLEFAVDVAALEALAGPLQCGRHAGHMHRTEVDLFVVQRIERSQQVRPIFERPSFARTLFSRSDNVPISLPFAVMRSRCSFSFRRCFLGSQHKLVPGGHHVVVLHGLGAVEDAGHGVIIGLWESGRTCDRGNGRSRPSGP